MHFIFDINELLYLLVNNFVLCYFVNTLTQNAIEIGHIAYSAVWYQFPKHEQYFIKMISYRAQVPFEIKGLGVFACSLDTYVAVALQNYYLKV